MENKKCPNCGFINFATAQSCRKCETELGYVERPYRVTPAKSGRRFPILKVFLCLIGAVIGYATITGGLALLKPGAKIAWQQFSPPHGGISVMMPTEPTTHEPIVTPLPIGNMTTYMYNSTVIGQGSVLYCVVSIPVTLSPENPRGDLPYEQLPKMLDDELDNLLTKTKSTLVSKSSVTLYSNPGLEFEIRPPGNLDLKAARGFGKLFILQNHEYLLLVTASEGSQLLSDKNIFLNPAF